MWTSHAALPGAKQGLIWEWPYPAGLRPLNSLGPGTDVTVQMFQQYFFRRALFFSEEGYLDIDVRHQTGPDRTVHCLVLFCRVLST